MSSEDDEPPDLHPERRARPDAKCPKHPRKEYRPLIKAAWEQGWWCVRSRKNYIHCYPPSDEGMVVVPSTPRKQGTLNLVTRKFVKLGLEI